MVTAELGCGIHNNSIVFEAATIVNDIASQSLALSKTPAVDGVGCDVVLLSKSFEEVPVVLAVIAGAMEEEKKGSWILPRLVAVRMELQPSMINALNNVLESERCLRECLPHQLSFQSDCLRHIF